MSPLNGKVAIVTGAARSIGRAIAERLARDGAAVVINYRSRDAEAQEAVQAIEAVGGRALAVPGDLTDVAAIEELFRTAVRAFGRVDIVVANAGVTMRVPLQEITEADYDRLFGVNTRSTLFVLREAARHLSEGGRIVNISSSTTEFPSPGLGLYAASKAAAKVAVAVLAKELAPRGITVNSLVVGATDAGFLDDFAEEEKVTLKQLHPFGRLGTPEDAADAVAFLASRDARWISGQSVLANGAAAV